VIRQKAPEQDCSGAFFRSNIQKEKGAQGAWTLCCGGHGLEAISPAMLGTNIVDQEGNYGQHYGAEEDIRDTHDKALFLSNV